MDKRKRILVVDDERANRELLEALLVGFGHDVDLAADGLEAIGKLEPSHDLILLDVMMSGIDGFEVARRIRGGTNCVDIPICMVTALSGKQERLLAVEAGANDYIVKPIDKAELKVRTASLLRAKEAQDTINDYRLRLELQNEVLKKNVAELERASDLKDEFLRIASHDLKNPLTCILGFAMLLEMQLRAGVSVPDSIYEMLSRIIQQSRGMEKIVRDFLDFQILEDGQLVFAPEPFDLEGLAAKSIMQNSGYAQTKGIALHLEPSPELPKAMGDASQIGQVLDNLIGNAIKFASRGSAIWIRSRAIDGAVMLEISDNGPGLSAEDHLLLFVKYAKLSNKPTAGEKSSGLGLAICRRMMELNLGDIGARNNDGPGATFWIKLPIA